MRQTTHSDYTLRYSLIPLFYWGAFASIGSYASFYLLSVGFNNTTIGTIIAIAGIFSAIFQPIIASYADRSDSISLKRILQIIITLQFLCLVSLFAAHKKVMLFSGVVYAIAIALHHLATPLINSLGTETMNQGKKLNFGFSRAIGSLGYAAVTFILGNITAHSDSVAVVIVSMLLIGALEFFLFLYPFQKTRIAADSTQSVTPAKQAGSFAFFSKYRRFSVVLIGCILIYISHIFINNFTLQVIQPKGGGTAEMGTAQAIASLCELPVMFTFVWFLKKAAARSWFRITGIFFFLKILASFLAPNMPVFYAVQILQMFGWGLISVSSVYYVNSIMADEDKIKGQAYFTMTFTIGSVIGSFLAGALLDAFSVTAMMMCGTVLGLAGGVIILLFA